MELEPEPAPELEPWQLAVLDSLYEEKASAIAAYFSSLRFPLSHADETILNEEEGKGSK